MNDTTLHHVCLYYTIIPHFKPHLHFDLSQEAINFPLLTITFRTPTIVKVKHIFISKNFLLKPNAIKARALGPVLWPWQLAGNLQPKL